VSAHALVGVDIREVVELLNGTLTESESNQFWREGSDPDLLSPRWIRDRELALIVVRFCLDEWIDSGRREDGSEAVRWRNLKQAPAARMIAEAYWNTSSVRYQDDGLELLPPPRDQFKSFPFGTSIDEFMSRTAGRIPDYAEWKAHRVVALILASDLRLLIAKCRYPKCKHPYFLLRQHQVERTYQDGIFCRVRNHRRIVAAARHIDEYRKAADERLFELAAKCLRNRKVPKDWHANSAFKSALALHLEVLYDKSKSIPHTRTGIKANWVTRHWKEIERRRRKLDHGKH
jgi:hypothetical protein